MTSGHVHENSGRTNECNKKYILTDCIKPKIPNWKPFIQTRSHDLLRDQPDLIWLCVCVCVWGRRVLSTIQKGPIQVKSGWFLGCIYSWLWSLPLFWGLDVISGLSVSRVGSKQNASCGTEGLLEGQHECREGNPLDLRSTVPPGSALWVTSGRILQWERREQTPRLLPGSECPALSLVPVQPCSRSAPKPTHPLRTESEALNSLPQLAQLWSRGAPELSSLWLQRPCIFPPSCASVSLCAF